MNSNLKTLYDEIILSSAFNNPPVPIHDLVRALSNNDTNYWKDKSFQRLSKEDFIGCLRIATLWYQRDEKRDDGVMRSIILVKTALKSLTTEVLSDPNILIRIVADILRCWDEEHLRAVDFMNFIDKFPILVVAHNMEMQGVPKWFSEYIWTRVRNIGDAHLRDIHEI